jgi:predicted kinase
MAKEKTNNSNLKNAIVDIAKSLENVFKKYTKQTREKAWNKITSKDGEKEIKKILIDPTRQINTFQKLATQNESFKTWLENQEGKILYITRGISGSGKSTLAKSLAPKENIFSTDDLFMVDGEYKFDPTKLGLYHKMNQERVEDAMIKGISPIVADNTNTQSWEIQPYVKLADKHGYKVELKEPNTPWKFDSKELARRNTHGVPEESIKKMIDRYQHNITVNDIRDYKKNI